MSKIYRRLFGGWEEIYMKEKFNISLLGKYLSGNVTEEERLSVQAWINNSPENQAVFEEYQKVWMLSGMDDTQLTVDVDAGWNELEKRIRAVEIWQADVKEERKHKTRHLAYVMMRVAAVFILVFGFFFLFNHLNKQKNTPSIVYTASGVSEQPFVLADGSEVYLNENARITYPEKFNANTREINFEGEAFFNVAHNPEKPFIIHCGEVEVEVLGTSFDLCTCPDDDQITLYLESGKVRFSSLDIDKGTIREQVILTPGDKAVYDKKTGIICHSQFKGQNYLAWKTGVLTFEKTPLTEVFEALENTYDIRINTTGTYNEYTLTARFDHESPESIFEVLHTIFGINYALDGQTVTVN